MKKFYYLLVYSLLSVASFVQADSPMRDSLVGKRVELRLRPVISYVIPNSNLGFVVYVVGDNSTEMAKKEGTLKPGSGDLFLLVQMQDGIAYPVHQDATGNYYINYPKMQNVVISALVKQTIISKGFSQNWTHGRMLFTYDVLDALAKQNLILGPSAAIHE